MGLTLSVPVSSFPRRSRCRAIFLVVSCEELSGRGEQTRREACLAVGSWQLASSEPRERNSKATAALLFIA